VILILADANDPHADAVQERLNSRGIVPARLNLDLASLVQTAIRFQAGRWQIEQGGHTLDASNVTVAWPRRLTVNLDLDQERTLADVGSRLWRNEWNRCLYGFYYACRNAFWMNPVQAATLTDNKFRQLELAETVGMNVPPTICSNDKGFLVEFVRSEVAVALKFQSQEMYKADDGSVQGIYVNKLLSHDLSDFGGREENPVVLQRYLEKKFEARYTYVDGEHFVCRIDSQSSERASIDWRRYDIPNTPHSAVEPPPDVAAKVEKFMAVAGLSYGAFDFVVDSLDRWWFLEVNTAGQWLWVEDLAGLPISDKIAESLSRRMRSSQ
jgi:glutathione synthase/RimK-type ligase-like ATP-grasp enzyme